MFGDFVIPDALSPVRQQAQSGDGNASVSISVNAGAEKMVLYLPSRLQGVETPKPLTYIGCKLDASGELALLNFGGRLWLGNKLALSDSDLYSGYFFKDNTVYPLSFSLPQGNAPSPEARQILGRIGIFPNLGYSTALTPILTALENIEAGAADKALAELATASGLLTAPDSFGSLQLSLSQGYAYDEMQGEYQKALDSFSKAYAAFPGSVDALTAYNSARGLLDDAEAAVQALLDAADANPEEPDFRKRWERSIWPTKTRMELYSISKTRRS